MAVHEIIKKLREEFTKQTTLPHGRSGVGHTQYYAEHVEVKYVELQQEIERLKGYGWISVDDKLPEEEDNEKGILLYLKNTRGYKWQQIGEYVGEDFRVQDEQTDSHDLMNDETVTHWQPLPKAPEVG